MTKEKRSLFETVNITDLIAAEDIAEESRVIVEKTTKAMKYAAVATVASIGGQWLAKTFGSSGIMWIIVNAAAIIWIVTLIMAIKYGGFKKILAVSWKVVCWSWFLVPIFPFDLVIAIFAGFYVIVGYIYFPVIYLWLINKQAKKDYEAAMNFIERYRREMDRLGN